MKIQESGENYLETILRLENRTGAVRSIDIANELGYSKPSISRAMSILKQEGYIIMEDNGNILLTAKGRCSANQIYERHLLISQYLMMTLNIPSIIADEDACRIEHVISQETFDKIKSYVNEHNK